MQPETTFTIVGCGETAQHWKPAGHSIGLNDAWKWGKPTDSLLCCNRPTDFTRERLSVITSSTPKDFYSHKSNWAYTFPNWKKIRLMNWGGAKDFIPRMDSYPFEQRFHYSSDSSSFIALSLAYNLGAKDIILWGCDFMNHHVFNEGNPYRDKEVKRHLELIECLKNEGVNTWLGSLGTAFDDKLKIYEYRSVLTTDIS